MCAYPPYGLLPLLNYYYISVIFQQYEIFNLVTLCKVTQSVHILSYQLCFHYVKSRNIYPCVL